MQFDSRARLCARIKWLPCPEGTSDPSTSHPLVGNSRANAGIRGQDLPRSRSKADQLLSSTSDGVVGSRAPPCTCHAGDHGPTEQCYSSFSRARIPRVFIGHSDGVGSMRWDGQKWIDEGRLPGIVYQARTLAEDADGTLWVAGANGQRPARHRSSTGIRDSKSGIVGKERGIAAGPNGADMGTRKHLDWRRSGPESLSLGSHRASSLSTTVLPSNRRTGWQRVLFETDDGSTWTQRFLREVAALLVSIRSLMALSTSMRIPIEH